MRELVPDVGKDLCPLTNGQKTPEHGIYTVFPLSEEAIKFELGKPATLSRFLANTQRAHH